MTDVIESLDLSAWVTRAQNDQRHFREAVHITLNAIGTSLDLRSKMVLKGGMLMAIRYDSSRFTRDADFSTRDRYVKGDEEKIIAEFSSRLTLANEQLPYDVMCICQGSQMKPSRIKAQFPMLSLNIGYAPRSNPSALKRLMAKQSPMIVEIDYSYNEAVLDIDLLSLSNGESLQVYSQINLMAEKYRSLLQQPIRRRNRRQDIYDLALLLQGTPALDAEEQVQLLSCLLASARARSIEPKPTSLRDDSVRQMASKEYDLLQSEIDGALQPFEEAYQLVTNFYEGLPWPAG